MRRVLLIALLAGLALPLEAAGRARVPRLADCGRATVEPPTFVVTCADAGFTFSNLSWSSWRWAGARAHGVAWRNRCVPNCAAGHFVHWAVVVRAYRPHFCRRYDRVLFTRVAWRSVGSVPAEFRRSGASGTARVPFLHYCA
ncbi:MAG TPA: hypothetical protein VE982_01380 [Gaiellaceae bacterium]|nr:hypothetical protein [Gaiellaceae bacterium]